MVNQASGMLQTIKTLDSPIDVAANTQLVNAIDAFDSALTGMDNAALVAMIENLEVYCCLIRDQYEELTTIQVCFFCCLCSLVSCFVRYV